MNRLPWFRWFAGDQEHDTFYKSLTLEERGFFHLCLDYDWINGGLPRDIDKLARLLGVNPRTVRKLWPKVSSAFQTEFGSNSTSIQLELERNSARKNSQVGLESALRRWVPNANQNQNHIQNQKKHLRRSETVRQEDSENGHLERFEAVRTREEELAERLQFAKSRGWNEEMTEMLTRGFRKPQ